MDLEIDESRLKGLEKVKRGWMGTRSGWLQLWRVRGRKEKGKMVQGADWRHNKLLYL